MSCVYNISIFKNVSPTAAVNNESYLCLIREWNLMITLMFCQLIVRGWRRDYVTTRPWQRHTQHCIRRYAVRRFKAPPPVSYCTGEERLEVVNLFIFFKIFLFAYFPVYLFELISWIFCQIDVWLHCFFMFYAAIVLLSFYFSLQCPGLAWKYQWYNINDIYHDSIVIFSSENIMIFYIYFYIFKISTFIIIIYLLFYYLCISNANCPSL